MPTIQRDSRGLRIRAPIGVSRRDHRFLTTAGRCSIATLHWSVTMAPKASFAALIICLLVVVFGAVSQTAAPIKLARHPDYHAGKVAFSYLGDIWVANEDGSAVHRLTDSRAREIYPRFSPDGQWVAFSSNRYGNNDVFVVAAGGGTPRWLTFHTG